jgi:hypothetical protein
MMPHPVLRSGPHAHAAMASEVIVPSR